jgi:hypothetical protein
MIKEGPKDGKSRFAARFPAQILMAASRPLTGQSSS